ncbi:MAG: hypothetical protein JW943_04695 [Deltaproteobacteria bacterium]|nr:hypothetical protein [Deltaproteobacteria bacterium]
MKREKKNRKNRDYCRLLREMADWIIEHGDETVVKFMLVGIMQNLPSEHYGKILRCVIKEIDSSNDAEKMENLTHEIARRADYVLAQRRQEDNLNEARQAIDETRQAIDNIAKMTGSMTVGVDVQQHGFWFCVRALSAGMAEA